MSSTRTEWLGKAGEILANIMAEKTGLTPKYTKIACGLDGLSAAFCEAMLLQCLFDPPAGAQAPSTGEIAITPEINNGVMALGVLCHELAHAALPPEDMAHGADFMACCHAMGMEGAPNNIQSGPEFEVIARQIIGQIGEYPTG